MYSKLPSIFLYFFLIINLTTYADNDESVIAFDPSYISITIGENRPVKVRLLVPDIIPPDVFIQFLSDNQGYIDTLPNITFSKHTGDDQSRIIVINGRHQGHLVVTAQSPQVNISSIYDFILIDIARSKVLTVFIQIVGWIYFFAWSISFYPQIILNFRRQSVVGLNFDFLALNIIGHSCYSIFNLCLYTSHDIQQQYYAKHPHGVLPVLLNDVRDITRFFEWTVEVQNFSCYRRDGSESELYSQYSVKLFDPHLTVASSRLRQIRYRT
jgi:cystinosin